MLRRRIREIDILHAEPGAGFRDACQRARGRVLVLSDARTDAPLGAVGFALGRLRDGLDVVALGGRYLVLRRTRAWRAFDALVGRRDPRAARAALLRRARSARARVRRDTSHTSRRRSWLRLFAFAARAPSTPSSRASAAALDGPPPMLPYEMDLLATPGPSCSRSWRSASSSSFTRAATSWSRGCRACASTASRSASVPSSSASSAARPSIRSPRFRSAASCRSPGSTRAKRASAAERSARLSESSGVAAARDHLRRPRHQLHLRRRAC